jgi:outer membrane receptor protein involved in Fe transport
MKKIFYLLFTLISLTAAAHNGTITGNIFDSKSKGPVEFAVVKLGTTELTATTDVSGRFTFTDIEAGTYTLQISLLGYKRQEVTVNVTDHETSETKIYLEKAPTDLKEVVITADAKANVNTISKLDISLRPVNNSQDILRMVPGLFIAQHAGGGKAEQIFLRGFDCDHGTDIALSVDGMPVNMVSHAHGQGYADLHFVIPELIERVNVRKGPYNASVGNLATAGSVQFQTKNHLDNSLVQLEGGMYHNYRLLAAVNVFGEKLRENNQNLYVAGDYLFRRSFFEMPDNMNRVNIFAKYAGSVGQSNFVTASASYFTSKWNASGQIPERGIESGLITRFGHIDPSEGGKTSRANATIAINSFLPKGDLVKNQVYYSNYNFELYSNFTFYKNDTANGDEIKQKEARNIFGYNGSYTFSRNAGKVWFITEAGVQLRYDNVRDNELSNVKARNIFLKPLSLGDVNELNAAVYIDENIEFNKHWRLNLGMRFDVFNFDYADKLDTAGYKQQAVTKVTPSPKLNLYYTVNDNLQFFMLSGIGFHSNDTRVVVAQQGRQVLPKSYGGEIGASFKPFSKMLVTASVWELYMEQEFVYVGDEAVVEPSGKTQRFGVDFGIRYQILKWLYLDGDFNYSMPQALNVPKGENRIPLAPTITSIGGVSVKLPFGLNASVRYRYLADRPANEDNSVTAKGYALMDAVIEYTYKRFVFGVSAENILNSKWKEAQFETESQLKGEAAPATEIHYTPGTPIFVKGRIGIKF